MQSMIKRGEIYWACPDEGRGNIAGLAHPHVIVQDDIFKHSRIATVIICALTTNLKRVTEPGNVMLDLGEASLSK
ncbi:type II toxin-antitoxin system PemK/MazF family toxin [Undibacterium umbellatum]|uniref:type II toxin-antitoxin system PemK/MazF family toxin n=2 Tax=Undibacterium umbellatum TaxID=2762300 RepID=UPI001C9B68A3|nr:type II toxin-antitoxin system PemK/MazF family toxin [Undibacterium umbellatum]